MISSRTMASEQISFTTHPCSPTCSPIYVCFSSQIRYRFDCVERLTMSRWRRIHLDPVSRDGPLRGPKRSLVATDKAPQHKFQGILAGRVHGPCPGLQPEIARIGRRAAERQGHKVIELITRIPLAGMTGTHQPPLARASKPVGRPHRAHITRHANRQIDITG